MSRLMEEDVEVAMSSKSNTDRFVSSRAALPAVGTAETSPSRVFFWSFSPLETSLSQLVNATRCVKFAILLLPSSKSDSFSNDLGVAKRISLVQGASRPFVSLGLSSPADIVIDSSSDVVNDFESLNDAARTREHHP